MLTTLGIPEFRATRDIDFLANIDNSPENIEKIFRTICRREYSRDGIIFNADSIICERIIESGIYHGLRVRFVGSLGKSRIPMQIDIGIGDTVHPRAEIIEYPTILADMPPPRLRGYSRESIIAEKFHTIVKLSLTNSRVKDFYDILILSNRFDFEGEPLSEAIRRTFKQRLTELPTKPFAFLEDYYDDPIREEYWKGFLDKNKLIGVPDRFRATIDHVAIFILPVIESLTENRPFTKTWKAPGSWR
jgi:hypothetical protein